MCKTVEWRTGWVFYSYNLSTTPIVFVGGGASASFDNQISKDTDLYKLYNTNIHEKIAEQKKREAIQNDVE